MSSWTNSHTSLPKLSTAKYVQRRDSLSSSRTRDSGYNSDLDSLSPLEIAVLDQGTFVGTSFMACIANSIVDLLLLPLPCVPSTLNKFENTPFQSYVGFDRPGLFGRDNIPSYPARTVSVRGIPTNPAKLISGRGIPRSFPCSPELETVLGHGPVEPLRAQQASQDEDIEKWVNENLPSRNQPERRALSITSLSSTSSCDMYTSTDISDDEHEFEKGPFIPRKPRSTLKVIELILRKVEISLRYAAYKQCVGNNNSSAPVGQPMVTAHSSHKTSLSSGLKRKSRQDGSQPPEDDDEDGSNKRRRGSMATSDESDMGARFACPFYKHDPNRYRSRRTCPGPGWPTVHRMKEHLYRSHAQPIFCPICYATFKSDKEQSVHVRLQQCERSSPQQIDGIDRETVWILRKRTTALRLEEDKWRDVYQILFPDVAAADIPSPCKSCLLFELVCGLLTSK
jgi:hypothetical protein